MHRFREGRALTSFTVPAPFQDMDCRGEEGFVTDGILSIGPDDHGNFWIFNLRSGHASQHKLPGVRWAQPYQDRHSILFATAESITDERGFTVFRGNVAAQLVHIDTHSRAESKLLLPVAKVNTGARFAFTADRSMVAYYEDAAAISDLGVIGLWRPADRRLVKIQVGRLEETYLNVFTSSSIKTILLGIDLDEASHTITLVIAADPREEGNILSAQLPENARDHIIFSIQISYDPDVFLNQRHQKVVQKTSPSLRYAIQLKRSCQQKFLIRSRNCVDSQARNVLVLCFTVSPIK